MNDIRKFHRWSISSNRILGVNSIKKALILVLFVLLGGITVQAQEVIRKGNTFEQVSKKKQKETYKLTQYTYIASDGIKYPIYVSEKGKYFIFRKSAKTGKEYRQYLPKVQEQLEQK
jgi:hypothetical protein